MLILNFFLLLGHEKTTPHHRYAHGSDLCYGTK